MDRNELKARQSWTLSQKIDHSLGVIDQFRLRLDGKVYVSFSGGKDSTVLLDLCRVLDPNIKAVFCNTGNEWPDIVRFVRWMRDAQGANIEIIHPDITPKEVLARYGFPLISKETSRIIDALRNIPNGLLAKRARGEVPHPWRSSQIPQKYNFLVTEAFNTSEKCCYYLKKKPFHQYQRRTGLSPILGVMASESQLRTSTYIRRGGVQHFYGQNREYALGDMDRTGHPRLHQGAQPTHRRHLRQGGKAHGVYVLRLRLPKQRRYTLPDAEGPVPEILRNIHEVREQRCHLQGGVRKAACRQRFAVTRINELSTTQNVK